MKKPILLFALFILVLSAGCKKEQIVPNRTILTTLNSGSWIKLDGGRSYTASINMPEIDNYFNDYGGVLVYVSFETGTYEQIPQVYNGVSYSYLTRSGQIVIEIQSSDGLAVVTPPGSVKVKIVLVESI
ncbi:hypothetical protein [Daejeonella rubra]|nr:hypothetical protein [Daejeonella rubra]